MNHALSEDDEKQFQRWLEDLHEIKYLSMPRFVGQANDSLGDCRLHLFCDDSIYSAANMVMDTPTGFFIYQAFCTITEPWCKDHTKMA